MTVFKVFAIAIAFATPWLVASQAAAAPTPVQRPVPRSLAEIRTIFIEPMDNDLDQYLQAEIVKKFKKVSPGLTVVVDPSVAAAIVTGVSQKRTGTGAAITGRWLGLHDNATGSLSLIDPSAKVVLWSSEAGNRSIWWGPLKRAGPRKVAARLAHNLRKAIVKARKSRR